jgi:hypothetical protein
VSAEPGVELTGVLERPGVGGLVFDGYGGFSSVVGGHEAKLGRL